jgi:predicted adenylyl cyclase CyaB
MRNLESKFRLRNLDTVLSRATASGFELRSRFSQYDVFFKVAVGKLKLRQEASNASLIYYNRDRIGPFDLSTYRIIPVASPELLRAMLEAALGLLAEVNKERTLLTKGTMRLHLDRVKGLGEFGEIEAVLADADDPGVWSATLAQTLRRLDVEKGDLIDRSYFELLLAGCG